VAAASLPRGTFAALAVLAWSRFRIQPLSRKRQVDLIRKGKLGKKSTERRFVEWLDSATSEFHLLINNPMFSGAVVVTTSRQIIRYRTVHTQCLKRTFQSRFDRDATRIEDRFGLTADDLRTIAEQIAFCMAAKDGLGPKPTAVRTSRRAID